MGYRPAMFPEHYDADGADATRRAHGLPPKVSLLSVYNINIEKLPKFYDINFFWLLMCTMNKSVPFYCLLIDSFQNRKFFVKRKEDLTTVIVFITNSKIEKKSAFPMKTKKMAGDLFT